MVTSNIYGRGYAQFTVEAVKTTLPYIYALTPTLARYLHQVNVGCSLHPAPCSLHAGWQSERSHGNGIMGTVPWEHITIATILNSLLQFQNDTVCKERNPQASF